MVDYSKKAQRAMEALRYRLQRERGLNRVQADATAHEVMQALQQGGPEQGERGSA